MPKFLALFEQLEGLQEQATEKIEASAQSEAAKAKAEGRNAQILMASMLLIGFVVSGALAMLAKKMLVRPLVDVTSALGRLAENDLSVEEIAGLCILFEEGGYRLRKSKPLRSMFQREDRASIVNWNVAPQSRAPWSISKGGA